MKKQLRVVSVRSS